MNNISEFVINMTPRLTLDSICYRNFIPSELVTIIGKYFQEELDNKTIREAVKMWCSEHFRQNCYLRFGHISYWDTSKVTDMINLFKDKKKFNDDISNWDTSSVTDMSSMFWNAGNFNIPLDSWNVNKVVNMHSMFYGNASFNQPLEKWNVSIVTDMSCMFYCSSFNQP